MLMLNVPATVGLFVLAEPIVALLFEHGRFLPADTAATAAALRLYAVGLVGYSAAGSRRRPSTRWDRAACRSRSASLDRAQRRAQPAAGRTLGFRGLALGTSLAALVNGGAAVCCCGGGSAASTAGAWSVTFVKICWPRCVMAAVACVGRAP